MRTDLSPFRRINARARHTHLRPRRMNAAGRQPPRVVVDTVCRLFHAPKSRSLENASTSPTTTPHDAQTRAHSSTTPRPVNQQEAPTQ